jgi:hypothetical protein
LRCPLSTVDGATNNTLVVCRLPSGSWRADIINGPIPAGFGVIGLRHPWSSPEHDPHLHFMTTNLNVTKMQEV